MRDIAGAAPDFGSLLRQHRMAAGLTQEALSERSGVSVQAISALERGWRQRPRSDTAELLVAALGLAPGERARFVAAARSARGRGPRRLAPAPGLPAPLTPLVGRVAEQAAARSLLSRPEVRLVTITGPPGVGKTRVGLAAVSAAASDAIFVNLAPISDPGLVSSAIQRELGAPATGSLGSLDGLVAALGARPRLLILDNFEHLVSAAGVVGELLARCPELRVVVTSRTALRVRGEHELAIRPLPQPDAVELFIHCVRARQPEFDGSNREAVAEVCRRVDCLPLAIELAAPWAKILDLEALAGRLGLDILSGGGPDLAERQRTMRQALAWSRDLLDPGEQALLSCAAFFPGGAPIDALEAVCAGVDRSVVLRLAASLVDKNMLFREAIDGDTRFGMLRTIREYVRELAETTGEAAAIEVAHARFYRDLAARAERGMGGADREAWLERLDRERDNLRAALAWASREREAELGLRLAGSLWRFWERGAEIREGADWLGRWPLSDTEVAPETRALALHAAGALAHRLGEQTRAVECLEASAELFGTLGADDGVATTLTYLSGALLAQGRIEEAAGTAAASLALHRETGDPRGAAACLNNLAGASYAAGDYGSAAALLEESSAILRGLGDRRALAGVLSNQGKVALRAHQIDRAAACLEEALAICRKMGSIPATACALNNLGDLARARGDVADSAERYGESFRLQRRTAQASALATSLQGLAAVEWMRRDGPRAALLYGAVAAAHDATGCDPPRTERAEHEAILAEVRGSLGEQAFREAWARGRAMSLDEAALAAFQR